MQPQTHGYLHLSFCRAQCDFSDPQFHFWDCCHLKFILSKLQYNVFVSVPDLYSVLTFQIHLYCYRAQCGFQIHNSISMSCCLWDCCHLKFILSKLQYDGCYLARSVWCLNIPGPNLKNDSPFPKFLPVSMHILSLYLRLINNFYFYGVRVLA